MNILSSKDLREKLFSIFIERIKDFLEKRRVVKSKQRNDDTADAFEKFCDGIVKLSQGISSFSNAIASTLKFENNNQLKTPKQIAITNAIALGSAKSEIINSVPIKERDALISKFALAGKAANPEFIGPLSVESFDRAHKNNDLSGLRQEFAEYSQLFAEQDKALEFKKLNQGGFKVVFRSISEPQPTSEGLAQRAFRKLEYFWREPAYIHA